MIVYPLQGTTGKVFSLGEGKNKCEFMVKDGQLHFREYNGAFKRLAALDDVGNLKIQKWVPGGSFTVDEVVLHNGILYLVKVANSDMTFMSTKYEFVSTFDGLKDVTVVNAATNIVSKADGAFIYLHGSASTYNVKLPDALTLMVSHRITIQNDSTAVTTVKLFNNITVLDTLDPGDSAEYTYVAINGQNGTWVSRKFISASLLSKIKSGFQIYVWTSGKIYQDGDFAIRGKYIYECLTTHTSSLFDTDLIASRWQIILSMYEWQTGEIYAEDQFVLRNSAIYRCLISHVAGTFSADLALNKWEALRPTVIDWVTATDYEEFQMVVYSGALGWLNSSYYPVIQTIGYVDQDHAGVAGILAAEAADVQTVRRPT